MMQKSDIKHGDVCLFKRREYQSFFATGIRLITGSEYTHVGIILFINGSPVLFEQLERRIYRFIELYNLEKYEEVFIVRPKFTVPGTNRDLFKYRKYNYLGIADCLINHTIGLIIPSHKYIPLLSRFTKKTICSQLVADCLDLKNNTDWCKYHEVVEPDDYINHKEDFTFMGQLF